MKKSLVLFFLAVFLISSVLAEENLSNNLSLPNLNAQDLANLGEGLNNRTEDVLENPVQFPPFFSSLNPLLGIDSNTTWKQFIVLASMFFIIFLILLSVTSAMPFVGDKGWMKVLVSLIVTGLIAISHGVGAVTNFFLNTIDHFMPKNSSDVIDIVIAVVSALALAFLVNLVTSKINRQATIEAAKITGYEAGASIAGLKQAKEYS